MGSGPADTQQVVLLNLRDWVANKSPEDASFQLPDKLDGGSSDNIPQIACAYQISLELPKVSGPAQAKVCAKVVELEIPYLDTTLMADEPLPLDQYGGWTIDDQLLIIGVAQWLGRDDVVAKARQRFGQPLAGMLALGIAGCGIREIRDRSVATHLAGYRGDGALKDGPPAVAWAMARCMSEFNGIIPPWELDNHSLANPLQLMRTGTAPKGAGDLTIIMSVLKRLGVAWNPWGLTAEDRAAVDDYCKNPNDRAGMLKMLRWTTQNPVKFRWNLRRWQNAVQTFLYDIPKASTPGCRSIGFHFPSQVGYYMPPQILYRATAGNGGTCKRVGEYGLEASSISGPPFAFSLPADSGPRLWEIEGGGKEPTLLDGQPLDPAPAPAPSPAPPVVDTGGQGRTGIHKSAGIYGWRFGHPLPFGG